MSQWLHLLRYPNPLLLVQELGIGPATPGVLLGVVEILGDHPFGPADASLAESPFRNRHLKLQFLCFGDLPGLVQIEQLDAGL